MVRWQLIVKDLEFAEAQLNSLLPVLEPAAANFPEGKILKLSHKNETTIIVKALFDSAMMAYTKCFTSASKGRGVRLQEEHVFAEQEGKAFKTKHRAAMSIRHDYLVHASTSQYEASHAFAVVVPIYDDPNRGRICAVANARFMLPDHDTLLGFLSLVVFVHGFARAKTTDQLNMLSDRLNADPARFGVDSRIAAVGQRGP